MKNWKAVLVCLSLVFLFAVSCGGGGSDNGVTPPAESLIGTYSLQYYYAGHFDCGSGSTFFGLSDEAQIFCDMGYSECDSTDCDWSVVFERDSISSPAFTGTLVLLESTAYSSITFSGQTIATANSYSVSHTNPPEEGVLVYTNPDDADPAFLCSGNMLSLFTTRTFVMGTTQKLFKHVDWLKVSDDSTAPW